MQNLNCSLCYSFVNYGYKCTTFFIYPIKKTKKIRVNNLSQKKPSCFGKSAHVYCRNILYLHIKAVS